PPGRALARLALVGRLADLDLDGLLALAPPDFHLGRLAGGEPADRALQVHRPLEPLTVELGEHVAALDSGLRGRAVGHDVADEHALGVLDAELTRQLGRQLLDLDAEPSASHASLIEQLRVDL